MTCQLNRDRSLSSVFCFPPGKEERRRNTFSAFSLVRSIQKQVRLTVTGIDRERLEALCSARGAKL